MILFQGDTAKSLDIIHKGMNAATMRNSVINNNIANATTPNYKRQDITFQAELERALNSETEEPGTPMTLTNEKHIRAFRAKDYREVSPKVTTDYNGVQNNNGNSVDIDKEMMESAKNSMYYNALAQNAAKKYSLIKFLLKQ